MVDSPAGSTPLDFAYHIHSDVGTPHRREIGCRSCRSATSYNGRSD
ncbi:TGS domain-containing protein [Shigella flexneri]